MADAHLDALSAVEADTTAQRPGSTDAEVTRLTSTARTDVRRTAVVLAGCSVVGLAASFVLLVERIALLKNPDYTPTCSINPVLSCGSIMTTEQASAFGFPNPIIGVAAFAALLAASLALLAADRIAHWFLRLMLAGTGLGVLFVHWLIYQSLYSIGALCPYCMVVWLVTVIAFAALTSALPRRSPRPPRPVAVIAEAWPVAVTLWVVVVASLITMRFWSYWVSLIA